MSHDVALRAEEEAFLQSRRTVLLAPAITGTLVALFLIGTSILLNVSVAIYSHEHPGWAMPKGAIYIGPSTGERIREWVRLVSPMLAGAVLIVMTWRYRGQGRRVATCVTAAAAILMGVLCWWW